jgi:hypothetical protein
VRQETAYYEKGGTILNEEEKAVWSPEEELPEIEQIVEMSMPDFWKLMQETPVMKYPTFISALTGVRTWMTNSSLQAEAQLRQFEADNKLSMSNADVKNCLSVMMSVMNKVTVIDSKISVIKYFDFEKTPSCFKKQ